MRVALQIPKGCRKFIFVVEGTRANHLYPILLFSFSKADTTSKNTEIEQEPLSLSNG